MKKHIGLKHLGYSKGGSKREGHCNTRLSQISRKIPNQQLILHLKDMEKEKQIKPKPSRRGEIINIGAEINKKTETRRIVEWINKTRSWFFERINKINKPLYKLIQKKTERIQINNIMNERGKVTTNTKEIQF